MISDECERLEHVNFGPSAVNSLLESKGTTPISSGISAADMIRRPQMTIGDVISLDPKLTQLSSSDLHRVETEIKYAGYVKRQLDEAARQTKSENTALPEDIDYGAIRGLRLEAVEKLSKIRPASIGQASRISGVSPADISVLLIWLSMNK
jgi:tRNA uridine 5-carboxymethylaminomethyl modification enzyme